MVIQCDLLYNRQGRGYLPTLRGHDALRAVGVFNVVGRREAVKRRCSMNMLK